MPLSDGSGLLSIEGFWAAYYLAHGIEDEDLVLSALDVSEEAVRSAYSELSNPNEWPVFTIRLPGSSEISVIVRNYEEDNGFDYMISREGMGSSIRLASFEGGGFGPGISWAELKRVADCAKTPLRRAQRLLLLAPAYGDDVDTVEAGLELASAFQLVGGSDRADDLAHVLAEGSCTWGQPTWRYDDDEILLCDGEYGSRNPASVFSIGCERISMAGGILGLGLDL